MSRTPWRGGELEDYILHKTPDRFYLDELFDAVKRDLGIEDQPYILKVFDDLQERHLVSYVPHEGDNVPIHRRRHYYSVFHM